MTDLWFVLVPGEALPVKIFPIKGGVPLIPGLQEIKIQRFSKKMIQKPEEDHIQRKQ